MAPTVPTTGTVSRRRNLALSDALVDVVVPIALTGVLLLATRHIPADGSERSSDGLALALAGLAGSSLLLRRRLPLVALALVTFALAVYAARNYPGGPVYATGPLALYSVVTAHPRRVAYPVALATVAVLVPAGWIGRGAEGVLDLLFVGWASAAVLAAEVMRARREQQAVAAARRVESAERAAESMQRQLAEERLRIARDLHDSVAHTMATINVQSGVAAHVIERRPAEARDALDAIRTASGQVLDELSAMLSLLRADGSDTEDAGQSSENVNGALPRHPIPDLTGLGGLVERSQLAGLRVDVVLGDVALAQIPSAISTSAYRIVQEALTNVVRHAGTDETTVAVMREPNGTLCLEITDEGGDAPPARRGDGDGERAGAGMGLIGIRERAEATGGTVDIGLRRTGGFRVRVTWPA